MNIHMISEVMLLKVKFYSIHFNKFHKYEIMLGLQVMSLIIPRYNKAKIAFSLLNNSHFAIWT